MPQNFYYKSNHLHCEETDLVSFSADHETPYYLYSKNEIVENCTRVLEAGKGLDFMPCYALKANYNPHLLTLIRNLGFGADVVSGGELDFALRVGFDPQKIVFAGVGKTAAEIDFAIRSEIHSLNIESAEEMDAVASTAARLQKKVRIALRVNPDIEAETHKFISTGQHINKFGITVEEALKLYPIAAQDKWLDPQGIHVHIGSQITKPEPFLRTAAFLKDFARQLRQLNVPISYLDLGGGIGIDYENDFRDSANEKNFINEILSVFLQEFKDTDLKIVSELGRSITATAGILVSRVLYRKQTPLKQFIVIDGAMNNLIRPSLYSAHHEIVPLVLTDADKEIVDVVGPVCESTDFLAKDRALQPLHQGDLLAAAAAGAYGQSLSSNYNLRPAIAEYLVDGNSVKTIYKGRSVDQLFKEYDL